MAKLVVRAGRNAGEEFNLNGDRMIMGRRSACPLPIADPKASREHAVIVRKSGDFFLQDLSRNGTLLNGRPASKNDPGTPLKFGDKIKIGDTEMEVVDEKNEPINIDIPGYKIMERIGAGGMGTVYKARQLSMDRIVALKILNERYSSNSEFVDRFIREARAAGKLNHPNVIHVHDISRANGRHYFSMEFIDGASVKEVLRAEKKIEVTRALDIVLQCAKALEFAHENKIVHRDVKPDNIMLTKEGIVKIADLGIAKTFEESAPSAKEQRRVMGTPHYMAPEQALGKAIDHRVDIYSLGATFYHMVTGSTPFSGSTAHAILKAHIQESLPPIQELNSGVPDPVCFIIERMMAKLPEKRYPDMTRLIADIERVQRGVVEGIDRIEAGESTILRAIAGKKHEAGDPEEKRKDAPSDEEVETGAHKAIPPALVGAILVAVFVVVVAGVIFIAQQLKSKEAGGGTPEKVEKKAPQPAAGNLGNPEAKKLLQSALAAQQANDPSEYERLLKEIQEKYAASEEAGEAKRRLDEFAAAERIAERKKAETLLSDAKAFEAANGDNLPEAIKKYRLAMDAAKNLPEFFEPAKSSVERIQKRLEQEQAKANEAAYKAAIDAYSTSKARYDFDAARAALNDFIKNYSAAPQKTDAEAALAKVNAEAQAKLKEVQESTEKMDIPAALNEWNRYSKDVKDSLAADEVAAARQAIDTKAMQLAENELGASSEQARKYDYLDALSILNSLQKRLSGIKKWEELIKQKEESLRKQKALHDRFLASAQQKFKAGPIALPFPIATRFGDVKWKITKLSGDQVSLDPIPATAAPGLTKRLGELLPKEQYLIYLLVLPKELTTDDHKGLFHFCMERSLGPEAESHEHKTGAASPAP